MWLQKHYCIAKPVTDEVEQNKVLRSIRKYIFLFIELLSLGGEVKTWQNHFMAKVVNCLMFEAKGSEKLILVNVFSPRGLLTNTIVELRCAKSNDISQIANKSVREFLVVNLVLENEVRIGSGFKTRFMVYLLIGVFLLQKILLYDFLSQFGKLKR